MKEKLFTLILCFLFLNVFSQITVTDSDLVDIGDEIYQAYDTSPTAIAIGSSGLNQTWDFSSLQISSIDTLFFVDPLSTIHVGLYSNVNLSMNQQGSVSYFNKTSTGMYLHGISDTVFDSPALFYPLQLAYGLSVSDGPVVVIDDVITGQLLSVALPATIVSALTNGLANRADTALIKIMNTSDFSVDASGVITTPLGSFDALRLKSIKYTTSELDIYCSDTISGIGTWIYNVPFSAIPFLASAENNIIEYKYEWITNDPLVDFLVAEVIVDSLDNIIDGVFFQVDPTVSSVQESFLSSFKVYPIPATYNLIIEGEEHTEVKLELLDIHGKLIIESSFNGQIDLSLHNLSGGVYYLKLATSDDKIIKKVIID